MKEAAFLDAIRAEPDVDAHRLVFADWLDENGQADRAEFIRTQCELARSADNPRRAHLEERERRLLAAHAREWADPWPRFQNWEYAGDGPWRAEFRRGFLEAVDLTGYSVPGTSWEEGFSRLFRSHPIRELNLGGISLRTLPRLGEREELPRLESLSWAQWGPQQEQLLQEMDNFLRSPRLTRLRKLTAWARHVTGAQATAWLELPVLARLESVGDPTAYPSRDAYPT
jgi:uncharacterized protein (TIGR02996 family)